jgi:LysM repeat protein
MDYRTKVGDTMIAIAKRFDVSLDALEGANPQIVNPDLIFPNELIHIPGTAHPAPHHLAQTVPAPVLTYVVQSGDSMSAIAAAHGVSLAALEAANPQVANPSLIHPGELLNLPNGSVQKAHHPATVALAGGVIGIGDVDYDRFDGSGGIAFWTGQACEIMGVPSARWIAGYQVLCQRESSGLPNAINAWDTNAHGPIQADGYPLHCSRGVAQCIPDTFAANHVPHTSAQIYDPVANIAASMHYVMNRYGVAPDGSDLAVRVQQADPNRTPMGY